MNFQKGALKKIQNTPILDMYLSHILGSKFKYKCSPITLKYNQIAFHKSKFIESNIVFKYFFFISEFTLKRIMKIVEGTLKGKKNRERDCRR